MSQACAGGCGGGLGLAFREAGRLPGWGNGRFLTRGRQKVEPEELLATAQVVGKVEQTYHTAGAEQADGAKREAAKAVGNEAERVFNAATEPGFGTVGFFLRVGQGMAAAGAFGNLGREAAGFERGANAGAGAGAVRVKGRAAVALGQERLNRAAVADLRTGERVGVDEFAPGVELGVVLAAAVVFGVLAGPARVDVFLAFFARLIGPQPVAVAGFDGFVLAAFVALAGDFHERRVDDFAAVDEQAGFVEAGVEPGEEDCVEAFFDEGVLEQPEGAGVGHGLAAGQPPELAEALAVGDGVFGLFVAEVVEALAEDDFEHERRVMRLAFGVVFFAVAEHVLLPVRAEHFEAGDLAQLLQRVAEPGQLRAVFRFVEQSDTTHLFVFCQCVFPSLKWVECRQQRRWRFKP